MVKCELRDGVTCSGRGPAVYRHYCERVRLLRLPIQLRMRRDPTGSAVNPEIPFYVSVGYSVTEAAELGLFVAVYC